MYQYLNISNTSSWLRLLNINDNQIGFLDVSNNSNLTDFMADNIIFYAGIEPTISNGNYIYDLSGLKFVEDGEHEGFIVDFSITNTENYSYDEVNKILTVNNPEGAGLYIQIEGVDNRNEGSFTYKFGLPYILTYDLNGGSGDFGPALCYPNVVDTQICLMEIADGLPTRDGYNFMGWVDPGDAGTGSYFPGNTISMYQSKTIYAEWELETTTVGLDFNLNGGEGSVAAQTCETDVEHPNCTVTIPNTVPTRDGYNFLGWANSSTATEAVYQPGSSVSLSQNKTVFAVWGLITNTASLNFDLNGGTGAVATQTCTLDIDHPTCNVNIPTTAPTRNGYNFVGWAETDTATSPAYNTGDSVTLSGNKTLYAVWQIISTTVSLNFDLNGGAGTIAAQTCETDVEHPNCTVTIPNTVPTRDGYNFLGWANSSTATAAVYQPGGSVSLNQSKTVYAVWELITTTVSLRFDLDGGEGAIATQSCEISVINPSCSVYIPTSFPTKEGNEFLGWALERGETVTSYMPGEFVDLTSNNTFYAVWSPVYTLSYDNNGGVGVPDSTSCSLYGDVKGGCEVMVGSFVPTKDGYHFLGWADSATATTPDYRVGDSISLLEDKTIYAVWEMVDTTVSLSFDLNGGEGEVAEQSCIINVNNPSCVVTIPEATPTKENREFLGWADNASASEKSYVAGDEVTLDSSKIVYAVWDGAGDDDEPGDDTPSDDEPADDGDDIPVPDTSAPDTGANIGNNGLGAVFTVAILPMLIGAVYIVFRRNKKSHLKFD